MATRQRRRPALAALFTALTLAFAALTVLAAIGAGSSVRRWLVAAAAAAIAAWFAGLAWQSARAH